MEKNKWNEAKKVLRDRLPDGIVGKVQQVRLAGELLRPDSYRARNSYAVIAAAYNVESYLDDFFESMVNQTIKKSQLRIIVVDDGSTDDSALIVDSWKKRYPDLIEYVKKENGGQASARNVGLDHAGSADWLTFIDPDDFVSRDYFEQIDKIAASRQSLQMISCSLIFFYEDRNVFENTHPLKYRYKEEDQFYNIQDDGHPVQLSMSTAFFRATALRETGIRVNEDIRPSFEDADFVNRFLLRLATGTICFTSKARYFYRKRGDGSSTLDSSWNRKNNSLILVRKPSYLLKLLEDSKKTKGYVPRFIQDTVLYDLSWYFKRFVGYPQRAEQYYGDESASRFLSLLDQIFGYMDTECLETIRGSWICYDWKKALLAYYKDAKPRTHIIYFETVNPRHSEFLLRTSDPNVQLFLEGEELKPFDEKSCSVPFFDRKFQTLWFRWYRYEDEAQELSYRLSDGSPVALSVRGSQFKDSAPMSQALELFTKDWHKYRQAGDSWLVLDRTNQADDNGEHFYRWLMRNHPEQKCYFVLQKSSADWQRLEKEGFNLLDFGSTEHIRELKRCSKIISSHADGYVQSFFKDYYYRSKDIVFLQHGVIMNDLSPWLNGKPIDLMITSSRQEYDSIAGQGAPYYLTPKQVVLTGLPRHDRLLEKSREINASAKRTLLVMPTWRADLTGALTQGQATGDNPLFSDTQYAKSWSSFLSSDKLRQLMSEYSFEVVFYPHANSQPYLDAGAFEVPDYIQVHRSAEGNDMQAAFAGASMLVTDYSSVAFEMAYINRPTVYYQFDEDSFFAGSQVYAKGYFDYREDGFGPVVATEEELLLAVEKLAKNDFVASEVYRDRCAETFEYRDGKCCERVYEAVRHL